MAKLKPILLILLIFAAGFAGGVVTTRIAVRRFVHNAIAQPDLIRDRIELDLMRRLRLDRDQREQVHRILVEAHGRIRVLQQEYQPRFAEILGDAQNDIAAVLTPEQRRRFERFRAERQQFLQPRRMLRD